MPTAYHFVHYRKFSSGGPDAGAVSLEELCRSALSQTSGGLSLWVRASDRLQDLPGGNRQIILNKVADLTSAVFGELCLADTRGLQALMQVSAKEQVELSDITTAEIFQLDERAAPTGSQFIRGMAYWLAIGNHVFFVKTSNMTGDLLKGYISWLLKERTAVLGAARTVDLQAEFDKAVAGDIGDIRRLRVKGNTVARMVVDTDDHEERTVRSSKTVGGRFVEFAQAIPIVEALLGPAKTESLLASLGPQEHLAVEAEVKVKGRRTEASKAQLRTLANDLDDLTDGEVQVEGKYGKVSDGDAILRLSMPFDLPHEGANLLDFNNVADQLQEVYSRFVRDGKIPQ